MVSDNTKASHAPEATVINSGEDQAQLRAVVLCKVLPSRGITRARANFLRLHQNSFLRRQPFSFFSSGSP